MKKFLLLAFVSLTAIAGMAQTTKNYEDLLSVDKGKGKSYTATVERTAEGKFNLTIRNFYYTAFFLPIPVGNIVFLTQLKARSSSLRATSRELSCQATIRIRIGKVPL